MDYLQIFRLRTRDNPDREGRVLHITHSQDEPPYRKKYEIPVRADAGDVNGKIFVIDDTDHATMLWADEY